jgi:hypothetical protein
MIGITFGGDPPNVMQVVRSGPESGRSAVAEAHASICRPTITAYRQQGRLAHLSVQGLQHAQALGAESVAITAARLYAWNRLPSSAWRRLAAEPALLSAKSVRAAGNTWMQVTPGPPVSPWCIWRPRGDPVEHTGPIWKLYVSPSPMHLAEAVAASLAAAAGLPVVSLKYGGDAQGILRPDKLVVHLASVDAVRGLANRLLHSLDGCPAHGVPYTAELGGNGLISWGCDPPAGSADASIGPSWRSWVTHLLAEGLASQCPSGIEPWQVALDRVAQAGVDPGTWAPAPDLWARIDPV